MNRQDSVPFNPSAKPKAAAQVLYNQQKSGRIPQDFKEAMLHIPVKPPVNSNNRTSGNVAKTKPALKRSVRSSADKWKSSFKPLGEEDDSPDTRTGSSEKVEIYNPYDPHSSDSEYEMAQDHNHSSSHQDAGCLKKGRWDRSYSKSASQLLNRCELSPETRSTESQGFSTGHRLPERQAYGPTTKSPDQPGFDSISRPLDHRVCSPDRHIHGSSNQRFLASYEGQRTNGEEGIIIPEYSREMTTPVRLSPPRLQRDHQHPLEYKNTGLDHIQPSTDVPRNRKIIMDENPIICDLCEVELANGRELEDHLESKSHWDTLEHIQQQNNYDDLAIAFIQEVMLYKSQQCSRNIEDSALQALQENDHMTKIEMFHCAACSVFISTSASSVQTHITSQEHLANTKDFQVQQRRSCLYKAETMMKELKPQFEHFLKGGSPFN
ncbi:uncharacterized protein LOC117953813 [Etheostoma cragini]|uniref:uncharacterized protein LOC117953813 n=1 Tax=Etheostoma cragini TaxID=417921 RepID=UPI00155F30FD|nr:uncharacterized protein LOC117953813 [Etheostoma cragini]